MTIRVAVVDDQALVRRGFAMVLDHQPDIEVVAEAGNGLEAIDAVRQHRPDVVLMDIRMPEMDGPDATRLIRQGSGPEATIPIIAVTADAIIEKRQGYFDAGMNACVTKPINLPDLLAAIDDVMGVNIHGAQNSGGNA